MYGVGHGLLQRGAALHQHSCDRQGSGWGTNFRDGWSPARSHGTAGKMGTLADFGVARKSAASGGAPPMAPTFPCHTLSYLH